MEVNRLEVNSIFGYPGMYMIKIWTILWGYIKKNYADVFIYGWNSFQGNESEVNYHFRVIKLRLKTENLNVSIF